MSITTADKIQAWLDKNKLPINDVEPALELIFKTQVFGTLALNYDVSAWIDSGSTPAIVQDIIALFMASIIYQRTYADDATTLQPYAKYLLSMAQTLLTGVNNGAINIVEIGKPITDWTHDNFYPNDDTGILDPTQDIKFTMGQIF